MKKVLLLSLMLQILGCAIAKAESAQELLDKIPLCVNPFGNFGYVSFSSYSGDLKPNEWWTSPNTDEGKLIFGYYHELSNRSDISVSVTEENQIKFENIIPPIDGVTANSTNAFVGSIDEESQNIIIQPQQIVEGYYIGGWTDYTEKGADFEDIPAYKIPFRIQEYRLFFDLCTATSQYCIWHYTSENGWYVIAKATSDNYIFFDINEPHATAELWPETFEPELYETYDKIDKVEIGFECPLSVNNALTEDIEIWDHPEIKVTASVSESNPNIGIISFSPALTEEGEYEIPIPEGVFGDEEYAPNFNQGKINFEFYLVYGISGEAGIETTIMDITEDNDWEYYNLQGVKLNPNNLPKGFFIKKKKGTSQKFIH